MRLTWAHQLALFVMPLALGASSTWSHHRRERAVGTVEPGVATAHAVPAQTWVGFAAGAEPVSRREAISRFETASIFVALSSTAKPIMNSSALHPAMRSALNQLGLQFSTSGAAKLTVRVAVEPFVDLAQRPRRRTATTIPGTHSIFVTVTVEAPAAVVREIAGGAAHLANGTVVLASAVSGRIVRDEVTVSDVIGIVDEAIERLGDDAAFIDFPLLPEDAWGTFVRAQSIREAVWGRSLANGAPSAGKVSPRSLSSTATMASELARFSGSAGGGARLAVTAMEASAGWRPRTLWEQALIRNGIAVRDSLQRNRLPMVHQRIVVRELPDAFTDGTTVVTAYGESWLEDPHCLMRFGDTLVRTRCRTWHSSSLRFNAGSFEDDLNKLTTEAIGELMAARRTP